MVIAAVLVSTIHLLNIIKARHHNVLSEPNRPLLVMTGESSISLFTNVHRVQGTSLTRCDNASAPSAPATAAAISPPVETTANPRLLDNDV
ncbi:hypothetical protein KCP69_24285 [Salmonella enterica subsp. enterica]|nr:hypothetical protein KCP69_24285 [Salmonella enterica subsp. enterica]